MLCLFSADKEGKPPTKEKKKKKKKGKEVGALLPTSHVPTGQCGALVPPQPEVSSSQEEEKAARKKSKRKSKDREEGRQERRRRPRAPERTAVDELEAFLGGAAPGGHLRGGGDYEEL